MRHDTDNPFSEPQHEWLDLRALTRYAAVSERTLRAWIHSPVDPLPACQRGKKLLVRRRVFDQWLERCPVKSTNSLDLNAMVDEIVADVSGRE